MKITKYIVFLFVSIVCLCNTGCKEPKVIEPMCSDTVDVSLNILPFLSFCSDFFEGSKTNLVVEVSITGIAKDANGNITNSQYADDQSAEIPNTNEIQFVPIKVPICGSYIIDVVIRGKDGSCYKCCGQLSTGKTIPCLNDPRTGAPKFRADIVNINVSLNSPPPSSININPVLTGCKCCK